MNYNYSDITIDANGDLVVGPTGDLYVMKGVASLRQAIEFRLKTDIGDLFTHPRLGSSLSEMIGKRNTNQIAEEGRLAIIDCLTYGDLIARADINVSAIPVNESNIFYHVEITNNSYIVYKFDLLCDLENGIRRV